VVAVMIVVSDEALNARFEVTGQEVVFQQDLVLQGLMPAFDLALCLRMVWRSTNMIQTLLIEPFSQLAGDVTGAVVRQQTGFVPNGNLIAAGCLEGQFQRVGDIACRHCGAQLPGNNVSREVVQNGAQVEPAPTNDLDVGEVRLPHLVDGCGLIPEFIRRLDDHERRAGDEIMGLECPSSGIFGQL